MPLGGVPVPHEEAAAPVSSAQQTVLEIPASEFARLRAWVKYGMKPPQVAAVYGVDVGEIERVLRRP